MIDYIIADYLRILKRVPRLVKLVLLYLFVIVLVLRKAATVEGNWNSAGLLDTLALPLSFLALFLGIIEMVAIFSDDIKAKTMQIAIGMGIDRPKVVAVKLIETALLILTDVVVMFLIVIVLSIVTKAPIQSQQVPFILANFLSYWITGVGYIALVMPIIFWAQGVLGATLLYLFLSSGAVYHLLRLLMFVGPEFVRRLHVERFTLDSILEVLRTQMIMGRLNVGALLGLIIYLALGYGLTFLVFRRQELEF